MKIAFLTSGGIAPCLSASIASLIENYNNVDSSNEFVGYLNEGLQTFTDYDSKFLGIINTFSELDERGRKLSKPLRIKKYVVREGDTYKQLASKSNIPFNPEDQLRLLNGDFPDRPLVAGRSIKVVN